MIVGVGVIVSVFVWSLSEWIAEAIQVPSVKKRRGRGRRGRGRP